MASEQYYGLIGFPLSHSFSASFFRQKFQLENLSARYENFEMEEITDLRSLVYSIPQLRGFNVTIPHKQTVIPLLDQISPSAIAIGAVNVVKVHREGEQIYLHGFNSDYIGFRDSLVPLLGKQHQAALVLGTGGSSRAVIYALQELGIAATYVTRQRTTQTIKVDHKAIPVLQYTELDKEKLAKNLLIINCTPLGMFPNTNQKPPIPYEFLTPQHLLYDLIYNPEETDFLQQGKAKHCIIKNGLEMLHLQAIKAWDIWNS